MQHNTSSTLSFLWLFQLSRRALQLFDSLHEEVARLQVSAWNNLAYGEFLRGYLEKGLVHLDSVESLTLELGDRRRYAYAINTKASIYCLMGKYQQALSITDNSTHIFASNGC